MRNYSIRRSGARNYCLHFYLRDAAAWFDVGLPMPHYVQHADRGGAFVAWLIDGYFGTKRGVEFLNDIIARMTLTIGAERLPYRPYIEHRKHSAIIYNHEPVKLKEFSRCLDSLPSKWSAYDAKSDCGVDTVFWSIKYKTEQMINDIGEGVPVPYDTLESWAIGQFLGVGKGGKDQSTIRAKCRSVWNWYDYRGWTIPSKRRTNMCRTEAAKNAAAKNAERARAKVKEAITGLLADTYKTKTGKWNASKIAEATGLSRPTVAKYLKELTQNG